MEVNEKIDVYSFGVVALEVIMGKHPGDLISYLSTASLPASDPILLKDVLDQRLLPPRWHTANQVVFNVGVAVACLHPIPHSRPTMKQVSEKLSTLLPPLSKPLHRITIKELLDPPTRISWKASIPPCFMLDNVCVFQFLFHYYLFSWTSRHSTVSYIYSQVKGYLCPLLWITC